MIATMGRDWINKSLKDRPAAEPINMASDPYCEQQGPAVTQTHLAGPEGGLQHVFVYVKDGLGNLVFPVPAGPGRGLRVRSAYSPHCIRRPYHGPCVW